jgi:hypothetical protein
MVAPQTADARRERAALYQHVELEEELFRIEEKKQRRPRKWDFRILHMIEQIEELNDRITDLGLLDEIQDTVSMREQFLCGTPTGDPDEDDDNE